jgi:hypothetical protein
MRIGDKIKANKSCGIGNRCWAEGSEFTISEISSDENVVVAADVNNIDISKWKYPTESTHSTNRTFENFGL